MDATKLSWAPLASQVEKEVMGRFGLGVILDEAQSLMIWTEVHRRITVLAHAVLNLPEQDREDLVEIIIQKLLDLDCVHRVANAESPRAYLVKMLRTEAAKLAALRRGEVSMEDEGAGTARYESEIGFRNARAQEIGFQIRSVLHNFTPEERGFLHARYWEGLTLGEMALRFDFTYSAIA